ncbi:hypothetical protein M885DRAFT_514231 [Pelagophyceae sp. CCMP2097]|nr:hypothetical protein M885DRAFT_514231 [Pelagophyceae sp. CCMP2097]
MSSRPDGFAGARRGPLFSLTDGRGRALGGIVRHGTRVNVRSPKGRSTPGPPERTLSKPFFQAHFAVRRAYRLLRRALPQR